MASFGQVDLHLDRGGGAVFAVTPDTDELEYVYPTGTGGEVVLSAKSHSVIVRGLQDGDPESTRLTRVRPRIGR